MLMNINQTASLLQYYSSDYKRKTTPQTQKVLKNNCVIIVLGTHVLVPCGGFNAIFAWTTYRGLVDFVPVYLIGKMSVPTCMVMGFAWEVLVF